jgi:putative membrane protein
MLFALTLLFAQVTEVPATSPAPITHWYPATFGESVLATVVFGGLGIVMAILGFKIFDWLTPGSLQQEIFEKHNIAAAILGGAFILGVCWIIAAVVS